MGNRRPGWKFLATIPPWLGYRENSGMGRRRLLHRDGRDRPKNIRGV